ncbi:hypothetical protein LCGC14_1511630, partial [marine sediment metagenome]
MATTVTGKITAAVSANFSKDLDIGAVSATPQASVSLAFTNGAGANKVEAVGMKAGTVAGSGTVDIDLAGVLTDPAGDVITFTKVKGFIIKNTEAVGTGTGFEVGGTFASWVKAAGDEVVVHPGGFLASSGVFNESDHLTKWPTDLDIAVVALKASVTASLETNLLSAPAF